MEIEDEENFEVRDSNGNLLQNGDTVFVIKDLKVKGVQQVLSVAQKLKTFVSVMKPKESQEAPKA